MTANTLKTALTVTGSGALNFFGLTCVDTTSRTMRIKITLDGVVVSDATSAAIVTTDLGGYPIGAMFNATSNPIAVFDEIGFVSSCLIEIASSVTETDKFNVFMRYRTN
ncbi:MAG: hypothetical protein A3E01_00170 [Gammaproteobacteria bacterium RIFCSPHIGHO2_12_FULL_63_22]|nr:MAG: hypothetical protein A3E01_00170 [Gammaproteobacteria bacterium RIFCSPHIGHO2_12_FULL_63_22]